MSSRLKSMARFDEEIPEPRIVGKCAYSDEDIHAGDMVILTYDGEIVLEDNWYDYCDLMYRDRRGVIGEDGEIY